jgi:hypothetical protein
VGDLGTTECVLREGEPEAARTAGHVPALGQRTRQKVERNVLSSCTQ